MQYVKVYFMLPFTVTGEKGVFWSIREGDEGVNFAADWCSCTTSFSQQYFQCVCLLQYIFLNFCISHLVMFVFCDWD